MCRTKTCGWIHGGTISAQCKRELSNLSHLIEQAPCEVIALPIIRNLQSSHSLWTGRGLQGESSQNRLRFKMLKWISQGWVADSCAQLVQNLGPSLLGVCWDRQGGVDLEISGLYARHFTHAVSLYHTARANWPSFKNALGESLCGVCMWEGGVGRRWRLRFPWRHSQYLLHHWIPKANTVPGTEGKANKYLLNEWRNVFLLGEWMNICKL